VFLLETESSDDFCRFEVLTLELSDGAGAWIESRGASGGARGEGEAADRKGTVGGDDSRVGGQVVGGGHRG
jgi:hypothetical protein